MGHLLILECKKAATNIIYWMFVAALAFVFYLDYGNVESEEINHAANPSSMFYHAPEGQYATEKKNLSEKSSQKQMMLAVTKKLLHCYKDNSYEYYPFGYIKEKNLSEAEQNQILQYLQEITGMDKPAIEKGDEEAIAEEPKTSPEIEISGPEAYEAKPGTGSMDEAGRYVFQPDAWEHIKNPSASAGKSKELSIQVSFQRFMDIMDEISNMIGKNSYFSRSLIKLYYGENDMDASPITLQQHEEFYNKDKITGAFARYYCDSISLAMLFLPALVIAAMMAGDKRNQVTELAYAKPVSSLSFISARYLAAAGMMFAPVLLLPLRSFIILARYANATGNTVDIFAFPKYSIGWILPTLLLSTALGLFFTVLLGSSASVLIMGLLLLFTKPSVEKIAGGDYSLFDLAVRHNTLKGFGRMMQHFHMLITNRLLITGIALLLVLLSTWIYQVKRRGGLNLMRKIRIGNFR